MAKTIAQVSEDTLKLQAFIEQQEHGATLSYLEIEQATGVRMDTHGKAHLRQATKRSKREYSPIRGAGIRLASAESCMPILGGRITRIDRAVRRADKSQKLLQEQFFASLSAEDQRKILFAGAVFGAIRLAADQGKQLYKKNTQLLSGPTINIPLPII